MKTIGSYPTGTARIKLQFELQELRSLDKGADEWLDVWEVSCWYGDVLIWRKTHASGSDHPFTEAEARAEFEKWR